MSANNHHHSNTRSLAFIIIVLSVVSMVMVLGSHKIIMQTSSYLHELQIQHVIVKSIPNDGRHHQQQQQQQQQPSKPKIITNNDLSTAHCLKARNDTVPRHLYGKLPIPYINLGMPKMGTTSLHGFFGCGGYRTMHFRCSVTTSCGECLQQQALHSTNSSPPILRKCGISEVYAQIDNGEYFPQIELLEELVQTHPNATFFLTFRSMDKWFKSLKNWPPDSPIQKRINVMRNINITGLPAGKGRNVQEMSDWFCWHVQRVRDLIAKSPSHTLVEVDIEDPGTSQRMQDLFAIHKDCWGHANVNVALHPELSKTSTGNLPWFSHGRRIRGGGLVLNTSETSDVP